MTRVLVCGLNSRPVALSAKRLGFEVHVVDYFGDVDLKRAVDSVRNPGGEYSAGKLVELARKVAGEVNPEGLLLTSEVGCNPEHVKQLEECGKVVGCGSEAVSGVRDWTAFFKRLDGLDIARPKTYVAYGEDEALSRAEEIGYPVIVKPTHGSAGFGVELAESPQQVVEVLQAHEKILVQEYVLGEAASVSALGTGRDSTALSLNRQLLGLPLFGCSQRFQYCGNTVPHESSLKEECFNVAEEIGRVFKLEGSFGVDFVLADKPYVIEVNPRFQDTLECVERAFDLNVVDLHLKAVAGVLPEKRFQSEKTCSKGIVYAEKNIVVAGDLALAKDCVDVYAPGTRVLQGEPVCSAFGSGSDGDESFLSLENKVKEIKKYLVEE